MSYDAECARHGWKLVPFALESLGAAGSEATRLLQSMAHSLDRSPQEFLAHAGRLLRIALQTGNAQVSAQGAADLLLSGYRADVHALPEGGGRGPGRLQQRRA